ncbi:hypothetical protein AOL_s00097g278 [Orbilia oligospora ATCC 24927]|uniref:NACHT domain-containing protein n=1 Tax=Arthrobotrys oligospora (strain ATCC 24927 / CBS 115.81 / DSM 1491) TaxID=756982 RepID=G1XIV1_ARTOA|nr:hypothetical protein AOL_s00097g278 [Orbilia oligospora ATCC 24927]EGX46852.1 hypothetical protein AOL_s00097g278 [Orbilia oligospora ATCC 24927]
MNKTTFNNPGNHVGIQGNVYNHGSIVIAKDKHSREKLKKKEREILRKLDKSPYQDRKDRNPDRVSGTCEWFVGHELFKDWQENKTSTSRTLWVSADPGCGKSVLVKYLVDSILPTTESRTTCYFFFKDDFEDQRSATIALCSILRQLFIQKRILLSETIIEQFEIAEGPTSSFSGLWNILLNAAKDENAGQIVCILDAIDECEDLGRSQLAQALRKLYSTDSILNLRFLLTSRPYGEIRRSFQPLKTLGLPKGPDAGPKLPGAIPRTHKSVTGLPVIHLSGESDAEVTKISHEIDTFIRVRVRDIGARLKLRRKEKHLLLKKLLHVPNRTYLWTHLVLNLIESDINIDKTGIIKATSYLPKTVNDAYEKIVSKSRNFEETKRLLHIVVAAVRPLTLKEMNLALALKSNQRSYKNLKLKSEDRFRECVRDLCGLFVTVIHSRIYLLHQTAKEFLIQNDLTDLPKRTQGEPKWKHSIRLLDSHLVLARVCIRHLLFAEFENHPLGKNSISQYTENHVFLDYSAKHWATHVLESRMEANNIKSRSILRLCDARSKGCLTWLRIYWTTQNIDFPEQNFTSLMIASYFGLITAIKHFLELEGSGVNSEDGTHERSALSWAAGNGHKAAVKVLTNINWPRWGAGILYRQKLQIDSVDRYGRTPLVYAVWSGNVRTIELLLNLGARVDLKDRVGGTPLSYSICSGNDNVVKLILKRGTTTAIGSKKAIIRSLLFSSVNEGDKDVIMLLLDTGLADPDLENKYNQTPLSWAIEARSLVVSQLLLARGAKINYKYYIAGVSETSAVLNQGLLLMGYWGYVDLTFAENVYLVNSITKITTPLSRAILNDDISMVELLLKNGAQPDLEDGDGCRPLVHAIRRGGAVIVQHLIAGGVQTRFLYNDTPLSYAVQTGDHKVVKLLYNNGYKINLVHELIPLLQTLEENETHFSSTTATIWTDSVKGELTESSLREYLSTGEDINGRFTAQCFTPLMGAVLKGHQEVVTILIDNGADVGLRAGDMEVTALWLAMSAPIPQRGLIVTQLLRSKQDINAINTNTGNTPLMQAISIAKDPEMVNKLVEQCANVEIKNYDGKTAKDLAMMEENPSLYSSAFSREAAFERYMQCALARMQAVRLAMESEGFR